MDSDECGDDEGQALSGNVVSWPGGDGGAELFVVAPVDFIREGRVRET